MIALPSATAVLRARLAAAPATTNPVFVFAYGDEPVSSGQSVGSSGGALNGTTNVSLVGSPAASTSRVIKSGFIYNSDSAAVSITVEYYDGTNARQIGKYTVNSGATLTFADAGFSNAGGASSTIWGTITGTLSDQTDLQTALNGKSPDRSTVSALTNSSGTVNIDWSLGDYFTLTLSANVTSVTSSNLPASGVGRTICIDVVQDSTGSRTFALPSSWKAIANSDTAIQSAATAKTRIILSTLDGGTTKPYSMGKVAA